MNKIRILFFLILSLMIIYNNIFAQSSSIKMNEIYSRGIPTNLDWIEIYNASATTIDISGYKIYDAGGQGGTKPKMEFPANTTIPAKGFYVIVTDIAVTVNPAGFGLSSSGEKVWLEDKSGALLDSITFPAMSETQSFGRYPDGSSWKLNNTISRGFSNSIVLMNEIYSRGITTDPDWIEIYNASDTVVNISGYKIYDAGGQGGTKPKMEFPTNTTIPAKGFYVIVTDISTTVNPAGFGLSSGGEKVWLEDKSGIIIDTVTFAAMSETQSFGRSPDGLNWALLSSITRNAKNGIATSVKTENLVQQDFKLYQNYPNPFNPSTQINYYLEKEGLVNISIFDLVGRQVKTVVNQKVSAGHHKVVWNAKDETGSGLPSGKYIYVIKVDNVFKDAQSMIYLK